MSESETIQELLSRCEAGDDAAAETIFRRYSRRLCELADRHIGERLQRRESAEDVVQSVFRTFFRRAGDGQFSVDHSNSLWRLLVCITLNKIRSRAEHHTARKRDMSVEVDGGNEQILPMAISRDPSPADAAALTEELEAILMSLDERDAKILRLCLQGYSTSETAAQVACTRWTVRRVLDRIGHQLYGRLGA